MNEALSGRIWILHALDVGDWIALKDCRKLLTEASTQQAAPSRRAPSDFGLDPQPVIWEAPPMTLHLLGRDVTCRSRALIYDFGVISQSYSFEFNGSLDDLHRLSVELSDDSKFAPQAREQVGWLSQTLAPVIDDRRLSAIFENYLVFQLDPKADSQPARWIDENKKRLALVLRGETAELAQEETDEAMRCRISYSPMDAVVIDWAAALVIDRAYDDTLAVLEFANSELLELRLLDERLDSALDDFYQVTRNYNLRWWNLFRPYDRSLRRLAELMADAAAEFEAVNNALKLTNDQFLARVYRLATDRFHLSAFDGDIDRKLDTLWEIHQFYMDRISNRRLETLEWIVIILIAIEILPFFR